ncbi:hypothetical protein ACRS3X_17265 [Ectopseudomonas hydrolytica]|uniref:hypothetical protein n=1 Tax=Ectopseudomonas hydrolytica TaxID=2493633 RepID=UPI003EE3218C
MKMAKPSARDIEAAEELHQVLQMLDERFGGPFQNHEAGDDLAMLLDNGDNAFDSDNLQHLQTLYNHLARLLRTAPNFYGRVIGGMVWVIMNEANQILDPESDCIDLHPRFTNLALDAERYRWLRARDLSTIKAGGVFAGATPDNVVLNGTDLDAAIDVAIRLESASKQREASQP